MISLSSKKFSLGNFEFCSVFFCLCVREIVRFDGVCGVLWLILCILVFKLLYDYFSENFKEFLTSLKNDYKTVIRSDFSWNPTNWFFRYFFHLSVFVKISLNFRHHLRTILKTIISSLLSSNLTHWNSQTRAFDTYILKTAYSILIISGFNKIWLQHQLLQ